MFSHWCGQGEGEREGGKGALARQRCHQFFCAVSTGNWLLALAIGIRDKIKINTLLAQLLEFQIPLLPSPSTLHLPLALAPVSALPCYRYCGELAIKMSGQFNTNKLSDCLRVCVCE